MLSQTTIIDMSRFLKTRENLSQRTHQHVVGDEHELCWFLVRWLTFNHDTGYAMGKIAIGTTFLSRNTRFCTFPARVTSNLLFASV